jgi:hypothetical protein
VALRGAEGNQASRYSSRTAPTDDLVAILQGDGAAIDRHAIDAGNVRALHMGQLETMRAAANGGDRKPAPADGGDRFGQPQLAPARRR